MMTDRNDRQIAVEQWVRQMFGENSASDIKERAMRLLEEAIEVAQSVGIEERHVCKLAAHVYDAPAGDPQQELGGVGVCALAFAAAIGVSCDYREELELKRIQSKTREHFASRHQVKVDAGVALPSEKPTENSAG